MHHRNDKIDKTFVQQGVSGLTVNRKRLCGPQIFEKFLCITKKMGETRQNIMDPNCIIIA